MRMRKTILASMIIFMFIMLFFSIIKAENWDTAKGLEWEFTVTKVGKLVIYSKHKVVGQDQWYGQKVWVIEGEITYFDPVENYQTKELLRLDLNYRYLTYESHMNYKGYVFNTTLEWNGKQYYIYKDALGKEDAFYYTEPVFYYDPFMVYMLDILIKSKSVEFDKQYTVWGQMVTKITLLSQSGGEFLTPSGPVKAKVYQIPEFNRILYLGANQEVVGVEDPDKGLVFYRGNWVKELLE